MSFTISPSAVHRRCTAGEAPRARPYLLKHACVTEPARAHLTTPRTRFVHPRELPGARSPGEGRSSRGTRSLSPCLRASRRFATSRDAQARSGLPVRNPRAQAPQTSRRLRGRYARADSTSAARPPCRSPRPACSSRILRQTNGGPGPVSRQPARQRPMRQRSTCLRSRNAHCW